MTMPNIMRRNGDPKMPMPKASNVPAPPRAPAPSAVTPMPMYDEEVLRVAQRDYDNRCMITQLESERDDWRRKALLAEGECRRLEMRIDQDTRAHDDAIARLTADRDHKIEELTQQRDDYKVKLSRYQTRISIQGKTLLDLATSVSKTMLETMDELKTEIGAPDVAGSIGLAAIADAIEGDAMPKVVTAGPADDPDFRDERRNENEEVRDQK